MIAQVQITSSERLLHELEQNLAKISSKLETIEFDQIMILIHVHDSFKSDSEPSVSILDPKSHASLARSFLSEYCDSPELLSIVQYHDEPYALWQQVRTKNHCNQDRLNHLFKVVTNWDLFLPFLIVDGCTNGKGREPLIWFFDLAKDRVMSRWTVHDIL